MSESASDLRVVARAFIRAAFDVLRRDHVIPTPVFHPWIKVGRDYFGPDVMALPEYRALEAALDEAHPERFAEPRKRGRDADFATTYMFSLLEACVALCARNQSDDPDGPEVDASIDELLAVLGADSYEAVCCRLVSHLTTTSGGLVQLGNVTVVPETEEYGVLLRRVAEEIPLAFSAFNREEPRPYDPPHSLLITREKSQRDPYGASEDLSGVLERFLLLVRLLTAGTVQSYYEVSGTTSVVSRMGPIVGTFRKGLLDSLVRRTVRLAGDEADAFEALGKLIDAADVKRAGMAATSFDVALGKFHGSHNPDNPFEHLVDLATALEAILAGGESDSEGLTLRLRSRVAALLATEDDPAKSLFEDVGLLYGLRSTLVHGGQIKQTKLRGIIGRISTIPAEEAEKRFGIATARAVDRMRDLVRRSILARLCLASEPDALWPLGGGTPVDAILADDSARAVWRGRWRDRMAQLGVEAAAGPPRAAADFLSGEDR
jgi:hypothetical protein